MDNMRSAFCQHKWSFCSRVRFFWWVRLGLPICCHRKHHDWSVWSGTRYHGSTSQSLLQTLWLQMMSPEQDGNLNTVVVVVVTCCPSIIYQLHKQMDNRSHLSKLRLVSRTYYMFDHWGFVLGLISKAAVISPASDAVYCTYITVTYTGRKSGPVPL